MLFLGHDYDDFFGSLADAFRDFNTEEVKPMVNTLTYGKKMRTNIRELDNSYVYDIELPGFKKEDIDIDLKDGYLTVTAVMKDENVKKKTDGSKFILTERSYETVSRKFYVGDAVKPEDVKAKYDSGDLEVTVAKKEVKKPVDKKITID